MVVDVADDYAGGLQDEGIDVNAVLSNATRSALRIGTALGEREMEALDVLLSSQALSPEAARLVSAAAAAVVDGARRVDAAPRTGATLGLSAAPAQTRIPVFRVAGAEGDEANRVERFDTPATRTSSDSEMRRPRLTQRPAQIRKQAPVVATNLLTLRRGGSLDEGAASYDGYASCPLVTGYGKLILPSSTTADSLRPAFHSILQRSVSPCMCSRRTCYPVCIRMAC